MQLIQVTWNMTDEETKTREVNGILEAASATGCDNLLIITHDEQDTIALNGKEIRIVPAWKWLLQSTV